jgi:hypothetical protein
MSKPLCLISGPVFNRSGYGDWATAVAKSIVRYDKYDVKIAPTRWGNCQPKRYIEELTDPEDRNLTTKFLLQPLQKQPDLFIQLSIPNEFQRVGKYNIGMTAGIETTVASGEFIEGVNRTDLTIALSKHSKDVLESTKMLKQTPDGKREEIAVKKPIEVCFWGADTRIFKKTDERVATVDEALANIKEDFAYLFVGQWTHSGLFADRKDIANLVKTFCEAFNNNSPNKPCLILKTSGVGFSTVDRFEILNNINKITSSFEGQVPNVYLLHGELTEVEMNALFNHPKVKVHISFTHGEGYGHPLLLQTLSGKPVLAPDWSGHLDFMNPKYATLLQGQLVDVDKKSVNQWIIKDSKWFRVSYGLAETKMKEIFNSRPKKIFENAELLRQENAEKFSMDAMDKRLWTILDQYVPKFAVENQFVLPKFTKSTGDSLSAGLPTLKI